MFETLLVGSAVIKRRNKAIAVIKLIQKSE